MESINSHLCIRPKCSFCLPQSPSPSNNAACQALHKVKLQLIGKIIPKSTEKNTRCFFHMQIVVHLFGPLRPWSNRGKKFQCQYIENHCSHMLIKTKKAKVHEIQPFKILSTLYVMSRFLAKTSTVVRSQHNVSCTSMLCFQCSLLHFNYKASIGLHCIGTE